MKTRVLNVYGCHPLRTRGSFPYICLGQHYHVVHMNFAGKKEEKKEKDKRKRQRKRKKKREVRTLGSGEKKILLYIKYNPDLHCDPPLNPLVHPPFPIFIYVLFTLAWIIEYVCKIYCFNGKLLRLEEL